MTRSRICGAIACRWRRSDGRGSGWPPPAATAAAGGNGHPGRLRVCADPNNLPFSNDRARGVREPSGAARRDRSARTRSTTPGGRSAADSCATRSGRLVRRGDGRAGGVSNALLVTRPYYRSAYVFVSRATPPAAAHLRRSGTATRPQSACSWSATTVRTRRRRTRWPIAAPGRQRRRLTRSMATTSTPNPPARIVEAVARGDVDVAVVWGPLAGYFAPRQTPPLATHAGRRRRDRDGCRWRSTSRVGVARACGPLRDEIDSVLERRQRRDRADARRLRCAAVRTAGGRMAS